MANDAGNEDTPAAGVEPARDGNPIGAIERPGPATVDATLRAPPAVDATVRASASPARVGYEHLLTVEAAHYADRAVLTAGGMGRIVTAFDKRLRRKVAIKELRSQTPDLQARFQREVLLTAKLQHPNIVSIHEAGQWPSGEPFYTMELVAGRPLDRVIADATTLNERLALLPHVIAVADALAYAHQERVIHRDLKPQNVMVGEFGETVVIDWGLGKDLDEKERLDEGPAQAGRTAEHPAETAAGEILGTPAYMPPEQAEGNPVDERADVYALGAILYHLLAGQPPYAGRSGWDVVEAVKKGAPQPLQQRVPQAPADLLAVVYRAMAREPGGRYATARGLADDLKKFLAGQLVGAHQYSTWQLLRRWLRRHRAAVTVAGVSVVLAMFLGIFAVARILRAEHVAEQRRAQAEDQRVAAQTSRQAADSLLDFMLVDLRDKLQPVGKLALLDDVAQKAISYYDHKADDLSEEDLAKRAIARRNLGDVLSQRGHTDSARSEYNAALAIAQAMATAAPDDAERRSAVAECHDRLGNVDLVQLDFRGAVVEYRAALGIRAALLTRDATNTNRQHDVAFSHQKVGIALLAAKDVDGALVEYRASQTMYEALAAADPGSADRQRDVAISRSLVGNARLAQRDAAGALAEYRPALETLERLAATDPANAGRQADVATSHQSVGNALLAQRDTRGALVEFRACLTVLDALITQDPSNATWRGSAASCHFKAGDVLLAQRDVKGAVGEFRASIEIYERLMAEDPTDTDHLSGLAGVHYRLGDLLSATDDSTGAVAEYRALRDLFTTIVQRDPSDAEHQRNLAVAHERIGDELLAQGDASGALVEYRAELAIDEALAATGVVTASRQADLATDHEEVAAALLATHDAPGSSAEYRHALAIRESLAANDPGNGPQADLASTHEGLGDALFADGDRVGARSAYQASLAIVARLHAAAPDDGDLTQRNADLTRKVAACGGQNAGHPR